ncbi:peptidase M14 [Psychrosphaera sp. B3R10]|uniref:M14 metallopeptidase family protein n=1 Tax=unclassified Psychrosphaera TaxID=2641570 RepID=UPI001C0945E4|nr:MULTISPECIES: M14 metallopeptidase family protein [unclassified Psychrosphaera]MBU2883396.1 peptidase M14 [Psychrosphaera sp. I2R16]MBU2990510.1 peptidase M14 [Psychrosphaera sp. B3R10]MDO6719016.1 M14 family metallopeptidase [Psychrosphaera sp. 1_MG-2023]
MNLRVLAISLVFFLSSGLHAVPLSYYLPDEDYNKNIPTPESVLGYQVGEWHVRHDQLVQYYHALAKSSDRVTLNVIGQSHEQRQLLQLVITAPKNQSNISSIQSNHIQRLQQRNKPNHDAFPLIVNLNYSVHGDESSGSNASMLVAYYLAASSSPAVAEYLDQMVVLLDPSLNPDGLSRFAQWANQHKGMNLNSDPNNREHVQDWIRGRVNHYWFDLNRDWLLLQHPESRARIAQYHQWRPNVLTDHHEMGTHSTFFFQPGIASRKNPFTPERNVELTKELATYHAAAFDQQEQLYFTEEAFDDFYAGKGSTYPDLHGTIGILFEQGSSRGHLQESINGDVAFPATIKNQITASFSTLKGSLENKQVLLDYQWQFEQDAKKVAKKADIDGFIVGDIADKSRVADFVALLQQHNIQAYAINKDAKIDKHQFTAENSVYIPLQQPQARLIRSIFSEATSFNDNTFYDVSSWNLAMAFNLEYRAVKSQRSLNVSNNLWQRKVTNNNTLDDVYSYAIDWRDSSAAPAVYELLSKNIKVRSAMKPLYISTKQGDQQLAAGTMLIHAGLQQGDWRKTLAAVADKHGIELIQITTGLSAKGIDLGSRSMLNVELPEVLVIGGNGMNLYEVGETWYALDRHVGFSPTIIDKRKIIATDLSRYTHIILADGSFSKSDDNLAKQLKGWVQSGGVLWGQKRAALWLSQQKLLSAEHINAKDMRKRFKSEGLSYNDKEALQGRQRVAGAYFAADIDLGHPLSFGISNATMPLFKNSIDLLLEPEKPFTVVAKYTKEPLISGYADQVNVEKIAEATALVAHRFGRGVVIGMTDNPNFRAINYGSQRLLFNALFIAKGISY